MAKGPCVCVCVEFQIAGSGGYPDAISEQVGVAYFKTMWRTCAVTIRDRKNFLMAQLVSSVCQILNAVLRGG